MKDSKQIEGNNKPSTEINTSQVSFGLKNLTREERDRERAMNPEQQNLFLGENVEIYLKKVEDSSRLIICIDTERLTDELQGISIDAVEINGIRVNKMGLEESYHWDCVRPRFNLGLGTTKEIYIRARFFKDNKIKKVEKIRLQLSVFGEDGLPIEKMSPIEIEKEPDSGKYVVTQQAISEGSLIDVHPFVFDQQKYLSDVIEGLKAMLKKYK